MWQVCTKKGLPRQVWNEDSSEEEVLAMVVRTGLRSAMGDMLRQVMVPVNHVNPARDPFVVVGLQLWPDASQDRRLCLAEPCSLTLLVRVNASFSCQAANCVQQRPLGCNLPQLQRALTCHAIPPAHGTPHESQTPLHVSAV